MSVDTRATLENMHIKKYLFDFCSQLELNRKRIICRTFTLKNYNMLEVRRYYLNNLHFKAQASSDKNLYGLKTIKMVNADLELQFKTFV